MQYLECLHTSCLVFLLCWTGTVWLSPWWCPVAYQELALDQGALKLRPWEWLYYYCQTLWGCGACHFPGWQDVVLGILTLGILSGDGGTGVGSAGCGSLWGMAADLGFSMVLADWMILEISCLCAIGAAADACLLEPVDLAWLLLNMDPVSPQTPLGVFNYIRIWGLSFFEGPLLEWPLLGWRVLSLTNCFGRSLGSSWCEHHTCWSPAWTGVMLRLPHCLVEVLMMAGRVVLSCLFCKSSPGDGVLQSSWLLSTVAEPDEGLSHPQCIWWICTWWSGTWCSMNPCPLE